LYDQFGQGFTLLVSGGSLDLAADALRDAQRLGIPLKVIAPTEPALPDLYRARLALIRPDQHVAWRGNTWPADGRRVFARAVGF
jgi:hypothetical protein